MELKIEQVISLKQKNTNLNKNQQNDIITIDSDDEIENADFFHFEVDDEDLGTEEKFDCVPDKASLIAEDQIEYVNSHSSEGNEFENWKESTTVENDPLAVDSPTESFIEIKKEQNCTYKDSGASNLESPLLYNYITTGNKEQQAEELVQNTYDKSMPTLCVYKLCNPTSTSETSLKDTQIFGKGSKKGFVQPKLKTCTKCGLTFKTSSDLLEHIDTHAVGKLYFYENISGNGVVMGLQQDL